MEIKITDYLLSVNNDVERMAQLALLVDTWNREDRGVNGHENVYDLHDYTDFYLFASQYGLNKTLECQRVNRFWLGGYDYHTPQIFAESIDEAKSMVNCLVGVDAVLDCPNAYKEFINVDRLREAYNASKRLEIRSNNAEDFVDFINMILNETYTGQTAIVVETPSDLSTLCADEVCPMTYAWYDEENDTIRISFEDTED